MYLTVLSSNGCLLYTSLFITAPLLRHPLYPLYPRAVFPTDLFCDRFFLLPSLLHSSSFLSYLLRQTSLFVIFLAPLPQKNALPKCGSASICCRKSSGLLLTLHILVHFIVAVSYTHLDVYKRQIQYRETIDYVDRMLSENADILDVYRICVPFKVQTCTSMFQQFWRPWEESKRENWVRRMPDGCFRREDFPFFNETMWDYEFQNCFEEWLHQRKKAGRTCFLIGIRTQESLNRWRCIYSDRNHHRFDGLRWIRQRVGAAICNAYPLYDLSLIHI